MEERKVRQIKGALLKCAEENRNKPTPTFNICVSALCTDAEQYIRELEAQLEQEKNLSQCRLDHNEQLREIIEKIKKCANCNTWLSNANIKNCKDCLNIEGAKVLRHSN